jgi:hypothetical protein
MSKFGCDILGYDTMKSCRFVPTLLKNLVPPCETSGCHGCEYEDDNLQG